jgi:hypothetical protein
VLLAAPAMAQWNEQGDAGDLPATAQTPIGGGPLTTIAGTMLAADADMYCIRIDAPTAFSATTTGGTTMDTQLWLFREDGRGVTHNDDNPAGGTQSRITGTCVPAAGQYLLAISLYNRDAVDAAGALLFLSSPFNIEHCPPDGPGGANPIFGWLNSTTSTGAYTITMTGVSYCGATAVEPSTWGSIKNIYR